MNLHIPEEDKNKEILMTGFIEDIDDYYTKSGVGMFKVDNPSSRLALKITKLSLNKKPLSVHFYLKIYIFGLHKV